MNKNCKMVMTAFGSIVRKVGEQVMHAAVFAYVSKTVTNMMTKQEEKDKAKIRVEEPKDIVVTDGVKDC